MGRRCEELRQKALTAGLDSKAALAWRVHCRSCPDCRTELFVLETLERQAMQERRHLKRSEITRLLQAAHDRRIPEKTPPLTWALRGACAVLVMLVLFEFVPRDSYRTVTTASADSSAQTGLVAGAGAESGSAATDSNLVSVSGRGDTDGTDALDNAFMSMPVDVPMGPVERRVNQLQEDVEERRRALLDVLDNDSTVDRPEDASRNGVHRFRFLPC